MMIIDNSLLRSLDSGSFLANASTRPHDVTDTHTPSVAGTEAKEIPDIERLEKAVKEINEFIKQASPSIQFSLDEDTGRTVVKMIDTETNQVVRQIPTKEALAISRALDSLKGMTVHLKA